MDFADGYDKFVNEFEKLFDKIYDKDILFLCIGTDRVIGDCFGPFVGSILKSRIDIPNIEIMGNLEDTLSYSKLGELKISSEKKIIAIDAALSNFNHINNIVVLDKGLAFGKGLDKKKKIIGDISIRGIVGKNRGNAKDNFITLQNISLNNIIKLSNMVANGIIQVMYKKIKTGKNIYIV